MISVNSTLFGGKTPDDIAITISTPLSNAFHFGDANCVTGKLIEHPLDIYDAFNDWLHAQLELGNQAVIMALDEIAYRLIDGQNVILKCTCNDEFHCHGWAIKKLIEAKLKELKDV